MKISKNFSLEEFTHSDTALRQGIDNAPGSEQIINLCALYTTCYNLSATTTVIQSK